MVLHTLCLLLSIQLIQCTSASATPESSKQSHAPEYQSIVYEDVYCRPKYHIQLSNLIPQSRVNWDNIAGFLPRRLIDANTDSTGEAPEGSAKRQRIEGKGNNPVDEEAASVEIKDNNEKQVKDNAVIQKPVKKESTSILMKSAKGERYLCKIPIISPNPAPPPKKSSENQKLVKSDLETALELLEPMRGSCVFFQQGWWTYEVCHTRHVRQFHQVGGATSPMNYVMGRYPDGLKYPGLEIPKTVARVVEVDSASAIPGVSSAGGKKYLSIKYVGGTTCDLTGRPRTTEVQYHCSQSKEYISAIQETSICNYQAIVHTPRLCRPPFFNQAEFNLQKPHDIVCSQIVSDEFYELSQSASNSDSRGNVNSNADGIRRGSDRAAVQDEILHGSSATVNAAAGSDDSGVKIKGIRVLPIKLPNQGVIDINELWNDIANVVAEELSGEDQVQEQEERASKLNAKKKKKKPKGEL